MKNIKPKKHVRILSIDGGGVRGIIPAYFLMQLEGILTKSGKRIIDCFDVFAGTSVGSIITMMLNMPAFEFSEYEFNTIPKYNSIAIYNAISELGSKVFERSLWYKIKSGNGLFLPKYQSENLDNELNEYFGITSVGKLIKNVVVPAYNIKLNFLETKRFLICL
jgi:patatin-like phospholipase/acyl hydrolase